MLVLPLVLASIYALKVDICVLRGMLVLTHIKIDKVITVVSLSTSISSTTETIISRKYEHPFQIWDLNPVRLIPYY